MQNIELLASLLTSLVISLIAIPSIVKVARNKGLYGISRKKETVGQQQKVPTLGGLAIFAGIMVSLNLFADISSLPELPYISAGAVLLFFIGIKDDILVTAPWWKLAGQILVAMAVCLPGKLILNNPAGIIGIHGIGQAGSVIITILVIITIINSYNLIDGIDGLAAVIGLLSTALFGVVFFQAGLFSWALIAVVSFGSLAGFTWYNVFSLRRKIYMGDTGSLLLGFILAILVVRLLNIENPGILNRQIQNPHAFVFSVLIIPLFDTVRIISIRIMQGKSPFSPDRQHIHYRMVDTGLTHIQVTGILLVVNLVMIGLTLVLQGFGEIPLIILMLAMASVLSVIPGIYINREKNKI